MEHTESLNEYLDEVYMDCKQLLKEEIKSFATVKKVIALEESNGILGKIEMLYKKNIAEGRKCFYKASLAREWFYVEFPKKEYDIESYYVSTYAYESLYYAILGGSKEQAVHMAQLYGSIKVEDVQEFLPTVLLGFGLKYVILDDLVHALEYVQKIDDNKRKRGMKQYSEGHARAYRGIIERDEAELNKGLEYMLKHHAARMRRNGNYLDEFFAYDSVALAMLAKDRGIAITVKHDLLPIEYLEDTRIDYAALQLHGLDLGSDYQRKKGMGLWQSIFKK